MKSKRLSHFRRALCAAALIALAGCSSPTEKAADASARFAQSFAAGDYMQARLDILEATRYRDDIADYWIQLARTEMAMNSYVGAYRAYQRAIELDPNNVEALLNLAEISMAVNRSADADKHADQILKIEPGNVRARLIKGYVALRAERFAEAEKIADELRAATPLEDPPLILKAQVLFRQNKTPEAIELVEKAVPLTGATPQKLQALISFYEASGNNARLAELFGRYSALQPDNKPLQLAHAEQLYKAGQGGQANTIMLSLLGDASIPPQVVEQMADVIIEHGGQAFTAQDVLKASSSEGARDVTRSAMIRVALDKGYYDAAREIARPYLGQEMNGTVATATAGYAEAEAREGRMAEAMPLIEEVLEFDETNPRALKVRALISLATGNLPQALTDARVLVRDQPQDARNRILLSRILAARGDDRLAMSNYREAFNEMPKDDLLFAHFLLFMHEQRGAEAAAELARDYAARNDNSPRGWGMLAHICQQSGDPQCLVTMRDVRKRSETAQDFALPDV